MVTSSPGAPSPPARLLEGESLAYAVVGVLCLHYAVHPGRPVSVQRELEKIGMACDSNDLHNAMKWLRRRGIEVTGEQGKAGYLIQYWEIPIARLDWKRA